MRRESQDVYCRQTHNQHILGSVAKKTPYLGARQQRKKTFACAEAKIAFCRGESGGDRVTYRHTVQSAHDATECVHVGAMEELR